MADFPLAGDTVAGMSIHGKNQCEQPPGKTSSVQKNQVVGHLILFQSTALHFLLRLIVDCRMKQKDPHSIAMRKQHAAHP